MLKLLFLLLLLLPNLYILKNSSFCLGLFPPPPSDILGLPALPGSGGGRGGPSPTPAGGPNGAAADKDRYFSRLLGEQSELSRERLKELERQKQMLSGAASPAANGQPEPAGSPSAAAPAHTCSLCGEGFPEVVALQVHIIKSHGAFPPTDFSPGGQPPQQQQPAGQPGSRPGSAAPPVAEQKSDENKTESEAPERMEEDGPSAVNSSPSPSKPPGEAPPPFSFAAALEGLPAPPPAPPGSAAAAAMEAAAKQFPHLEMLQRQMLSSQFPGLLPGPGGLPFPNPLQQLFSGAAAAAAAAAAEKPKEEEEEETAKEEEDKSPSAAGPAKKKKKKKVLRRRFKCSKCSAKFRRRENCLRHIHKAHPNAAAVSKRRVGVAAASVNGGAMRRLFSPRKKSMAGGQSRSQYVRQLMELLKVPTSRGTPQKTGNPEEDGGESGSEGGGSSSKGRQHIMQPFLLRAPSPSAQQQQQQQQQQQASNSPSTSGGEEEQHQSSTPMTTAADINFVPSLVYLPVAKRVSHPMTVAFSLTPA